MGRVVSYLKAIGLRQLVQLLDHERLPTLKHDFLLSTQASKISRSTQAAFDLLDYSNVV